MERRSDRPMSPPSVERRQGGRPPVDEPLALVSIRIPQRDLDRLIDYSKRCDQPVSKMLRQIIILSLP